MASQHHDWTVPAPLRALLWWPPVAFVLVMLDPSAAAGKVAVAGAALAVFGVLGAALGRAIARRMAQTGSATEVSPALVMPTAPETVGSLAAEQRAA